MRKVRVLCAVSFAVLGFGVLSVGSAAAEELPVWLKNGVEVTSAESALVDGVMVFHHKPPAIEGGGEITIECMGQSHGTVGPGMKDEVTKLLDLNGKESKLECTLTSSTSPLCAVGNSPSLEPDNLPWKTELLLVSGKVLDDMLGNPGFTITCGSSSILCTVKEEIAFIENEVNGAVFEFTSSNEPVCSDHGSSTLLGKSTVLGFAVSKVG